MGNAGEVNAVRMDWLGVFCSFGCALHCAAMPILLSSLPTLTTVRWLADPLFHQIVAVVCSILVVRAIVPGFRIHRDQTVATLAAGGVALVMVAAFVLPESCCRHSFTQLADSTTTSAQSAGPYRLVSSSSLQTEFTGEIFLTEFDLAETNVSTVATLSQPLLSTVTLENYLGSDIAEQLIHSQPYLSPIGGLLLIVAHVINIRLRCCRRTGCS